ncbi:NAD-glutamate dehydrogenase domain-containing protein [Methylomonas sp. MgM2]
MQTPINSWSEALKELTEHTLERETGLSLWQKYHRSFPPDYQSLITPQRAFNDILQLEQLSGPDQTNVSLVEPDENQPNYRLHFYSERQRYLDEFIPVLENMHLRVMDQVQFSLSVQAKQITIKSFTVRAAADECKPFDQVKSPLVDAIQSVMDGKAENDAINRLTLLTGMTWQECDVLRTYRNYYLQLDHWTTKDSIHHAMINNPSVSRSLFDYFEARFRPNPDWQDSMDREEQASFPLRLQLLENIAAVENINDDRILRVIFNLIDATVRSNFHQRRWQDDYFIAIKINSLGVIEMRPPKPQYEIYVHGVDMEGIHLRGGKVSRGGIRWSDRVDDFRTEILDLMQTQISKNALIIPTGSKGGFVVKLNKTSQNFREAGKKAYIRLIRGLLDLTDNYHDGKVVHPKDIVVHDDPDPYLVVAADKGTAKFSDIANGIATDYQFWLGDAFASGGSHGYDHKALGITARGAWECVKRHFRELGKNIQAEPFTVVGIGSMDGDVFGNGMLLSPYIRLLAAFSGQHIFIDPNPAETDHAFKERQRLFELAGSSWDDYDRSLISAGGGVFARTDKDIPVSPELKKWLGIRYKSIDGESLIQHLLKAPVELLWLGGIGTYVKASSEKHEDVGDRNNDNVRVDACDVGAKIVGEGANLGFTQQARIEFSLLGGRINTDAVDNSAGVDTSDHEVNLKILLADLQKKQLIADYQSLFIDMTDAVCQSVLADNIAQSLCLSLDQRRCAETPAKFIQLADKLEAAGFLDRAVESFPPNKEIQERPGQTLTRPELAVLMSASKMYLTETIENQINLFQNACYACSLHCYFPDALAHGFGAHFDQHPLANQIKATAISNLIINQAGCGFLIQDDNENNNILDFINAYLTFDQVLQANSIRLAIQHLDNRVEAETQYQVLLGLEKILAGFCRWSVAHHAGIYPSDETIGNYRQLLKHYENYIVRQAGDNLNRLIDHYQQAGIPGDLAKTSAIISHLKDFLFMAALVNETQTDFAVIGALLDDIDKTLGIRQIQQPLNQTPLRDYWVKTVCNTLQGDIQQFTAELIKKMLFNNIKSCSDYLEHQVNKSRLDRYQKIYLENQKTTPVNLLAYVVLIRALESLLES